MKPRVVISGVGLVTPQGDSPAAFFEALCSGDFAPRPVSLFADATLPDTQGAEIPDFDASRYLEGNLRPLDRASRLAASAGSLALKASGLEPGDDVGLVLGTMFGSLRTISEFDRRGLTAGPNYVKPLVFANTVICAPAGQTAIRLGLRGVNSTLAGGSASSLQALGYANDLVRSGRCTAVLAGGLEELSAEALTGLWSAGRLAGSSAAERPHPIPFAPGRNGFLLAEGAALAVLEPAEQAQIRGADILGEIVGFGQANDPTNGRDPESAALALERAIDSALADASVDRTAIGAVFASAAGNPVTDAHEADALHRALGSRVPVTAIKSVTGEALGCSGALQTLAAIQSLDRGRLPGTLGLEAVDPSLPPLDISASTRNFKGSHALVTGLAFDGPAAALVVAGAQRETR